MSKAFIPLLIFVLMVAVMLLVSEGLTSERWTTVTPTVWRYSAPSTSTPVPQQERTRWWEEIGTPTPKPTLKNTSESVNP